MLTAITLVACSGLYLGNSISSVAVLGSRPLHSSGPMLVGGGDKRGDAPSSGKRGGDVGSADGPSTAIPPMTVSMTEGDKPDLLDLVSGYMYFVTPIL